LFGLAVFLPSETAGATLYAPDGPSAWRVLALAAPLPLGVVAWAGGQGSLRCFGTGLLGGVLALALIFLFWIGFPFLTWIPFVPWCVAGAVVLLMLLYFPALAATSGEIEGESPDDRARTIRFP
jgi:hypothetical protein